MVTGGPTLDQLRVLDAVAVEGSFSAAGRRLRRAQSAVSYAIAQLEAQLGVSLFDRSGRKPVLTPAGTALLADGRAVLERVAALATHARSISAGVEPRVAIAVDVMFPIERLIASLTAFESAHPDTPVRVHTEALGAVAQSVLDEECDVGISGFLPEPPPSLDTESFCVTPMVCVTSASHPLARAGGEITAAELRQHVQLVLTDRSALTVGYRQGQLDGRGWQFADLHTRLACLRAGLGWCNMPLHMVADDLAAGRLIAIESAAFPRSQRHAHYLVYRRAQPPGPATRWLLQHLRSP